MIYLIIGIAAGVLAGLFGIGGGIIVVPALIFFQKMSQTMASGTSLGALLLPVGALGAWEYYKRGEMNVSAALLIALGIFVGVAGGAALGLHLVPRQAQRAFAVFLVLVAGWLWARA